MPVGPNGILAFNNVLEEHSNTPFSSDATALHPSYNYTLDLQGLSSNVTCAYPDPGTESPVKLSALDTEQLIYGYNATCPPSSDGSRPLLWNVSYYDIGITDHGLISWTCQMAENSYTLYLRGLNTYATKVGNITCTISSIQPTMFPLTYTGQLDSFTAQSARSYSPTLNPITQQLATNMLPTIGNAVWESQSLESNAIAESIITLGIKALNQAPYTLDRDTLKLYEQMIQGILDYEVSLVYCPFSALMPLHRPHTFAYCTLHKPMKPRQRVATVQSMVPRI